jgi:hypothetical protein
LPVPGGQALLHGTLGIGERLDHLNGPAAHADLGECQKEDPRDQESTGEQGNHRNGESHSPAGEECFPPTDSPALTA